MSNIGKAFQNGKAFIGFVTGGDPSLEKSEEFIFEMIRAGADLIEIGAPFSDPIAEGPVIQRANLRALAAGVTTDKLFELAARVRRQSDIPLVFLTYLNPVLHYGYEAYFQKCQTIGLDGIIIPDLPFEEQEEVRAVSVRCSVDLISLVAPTSESRIAKIAKNAAGFVYIVSSMGVTGIRGEITTDLNAILAAVRSASDIPAAVGFGVSTPEQAAHIARIADGVIVGSAIVKIIEEYGERAGEHLFAYVQKMKEAISQA
ncbi:MAG: tryptophan synthase subunit alpha [Clostridiales bacterium]|jgi:tryptophan synthase alpha chain|nr:tryptophan synthase subunit alpha [Clostridiales bacterium]